MYIHVHVHVYVCMYTLCTVLQCTCGVPDNEALGIPC